MDALTPSAGAVHFPQGARTPHTSTASISWPPRASVWPPSNASGRPPWWFPLKKWLMPVYFRKAKPFPWLGSGDCREAKSGKEEMKGGWKGYTDSRDAAAPLESGKRWARDNQKQLAKAVQDPLWTWVTERCGKESKAFSSRMPCSLFIKLWNTDILWLPACCHLSRLLFNCWFHWLILSWRTCVLKSLQQKNNNNGL